METIVRYLFQGVFAPGRAQSSIAGLSRSGHGTERCAHGGCPRTSYLPGPRGGLGPFYSAVSLHQPCMSFSWQLWIDAFIRCTVARRIGYTAVR